MMNAREAVKRAIEFKGPQWTPYSLGVAPEQLEPFWSPAQIEAMKAELRALGAEEVNGHFGAQPLFVEIGPKPTAFPEPYRPLQEDEWVDEWGVVWTCREFPRVIGHPMESGWEALPSFQAPDPRAPGRYAQVEAQIAKHPDRYRRGHVWFTLFERLWFLRGFNNMLMDPYTHPQEFAQLRDQILEFSIISIQEQLRLGVDAIFFSDDWGTQLGLLMNPDDWRKWYKPCYKEMFEAVHAGGGHVWMHLCGNVTAIIGDLIEVGLDVLNPIQPMAMNVDKLAAEFGGHVCFNGGADVQGTLPHGTVADVEREVEHLIDIFGRYNGGYIGATSHSIMPETPPENIVALFRAFREYSGWSAIQKQSE